VGGAGGAGGKSGAGAPGDTGGTGGASGADSAGDAEGAGKLVSHHVLKSSFNALAKVAHLVNLLQRTATCSCCKRWATHEFYSAGCFCAAVAVVGRGKRDRMLQENATGVAKELGRRDVMVSDEKRHRVNKAVLLEPTTARNVRKESMLSTLLKVQFALEARGATSRDMASSDFALHQFTEMFAAARGEEPKLLCTYISATKMTERVVRCIGVLPYVDPWKCSAGARRRRRLNLRPSSCPTTRHSSRLASSRRTFGRWARSLAFATSRSTGCSRR